MLPRSGLSTVFPDNLYTHDGLFSLPKGEKTTLKLVIRNTKTEIRKKVNTSNILFRNHVLKFQLETRVTQTPESPEQPHRIKEPTLWASPRA